MNATAGVQSARAPAPDQGAPARPRPDGRVLLWAVSRPVVEGRPAPRQRDPAYLALAPRDRGRLLPRLHPRLDPDARRVGIHVPYRVALQAEMVSMLAKYLPGGVWTPAARTVALRNRGRHRYAHRARVDPRRGCAVRDLGRDRLRRQPRVGARTCTRRSARSSPSRCCSPSLLHPRIFRPLFNKLLKPFGAETIEPLPFPLTLGLLLFYCGTWLIGGFAVYFMLRSLGAIPALDDPVPRRRLRRRRDRRGARGLRAVAASARVRRRCTGCCSPCTTPAPRSA